MPDVIYALSIAAIALVAGVAVFAIVRTLVRAARNNNAPILSADARVVAKRSEAGGGHFATFAISSGNEMEFEITAGEYDMLAVGEPGKLTFQGMRYVSFVQESPLSLEGGPHS